VPVLPVSVQAGADILSAAMSPPKPG
jgi:hypothetical protein